MLSRWPRWQAVALVFLVQLLLIALFGPVVLLPALIEESVTSRELSNYLSYLSWIASFGWLWELGDPETWIVIGMMVTWAGLAALFVVPVVGRVETTTGGRSLWPSIVAAAAMGAFISAMLFAAVAEGLVAAVTRERSRFEDAQEIAAPWIWGGALAMWLCSGFVWMYLLRRVGRTRDPIVLDRLLRVVFVGTSVELALGLPIYLFVRKRYSCYCALATFINLVMGVAALFWLCGPWAVLLWTREARRNWSRGACRACGYPQRSGSVVCSECGAALG
ncbi:MAG: hypothetical protein RIT24_647 [Planctomycetota bacterium]|jgi:hypothetical protein